MTIDYDITVTAFLCVLLPRKKTLTCNNKHIDLYFYRNVNLKPGTSQNRPHVRNTAIPNQAYNVSYISFPPHELFIYLNFGEGNMLLYQLLVT